MYRCPTCSEVYRPTEQHMCPKYHRPDHRVPPTKEYSLDDSGCLQPGDASATTKILVQRDAVVSELSETRAAHIEALAHAVIRAYQGNPIDLELVEVRGVSEWRYFFRKREGQ